MQTSHAIKETLPDGRMQFSSDNCRFVFQRLRPGALLVTVSGLDSGQFGTAALDEFRMELLRYYPLEILVDARDAIGVAVEVSRDWTRFFSENRQRLKRVSVLAGSKMVQLTVEIAQHLSHTGNLIQIYSDVDLFDEAVARARMAN